MSQEGDQGASQSGVISQDMETKSPCSGKRCRDQSEVGMDAPCIKAVDLNLSSHIVSGGGGGNGGEDQHPVSNDLSLTQSEKRMKCGPSNSNSESNSQTPEIHAAASDAKNNVSTEISIQSLSRDIAAAIAKVSSVKAAEVHTAGIERRPQFHCDICSVKSTSAKDLDTHLTGKRHATRVRELAKGIGTLGFSNSSYDVSEAQVHTSQVPICLNLLTTSIGQQGPVDGSVEAFKSSIPGCTSGTREDLQPFLSKLPNSSDPISVSEAQLISINRPLNETLVNEGSKNDPSSKLHCDDDHSRFCNQPGINGTCHDLALTDGLLEKICTRITSEGEPFKNLITALSTKSISACVARALASTINICGCPGVRDLQKAGSVQVAGCVGSQIEGAMSSDSNGMVTMHARCFSNLLHEVQICVMEDLLYGGHVRNSWLPSVVPVPAPAPQGEDLHCSVCRVEYGSKADLDLHLAGKKHASLVQRVYSRCQLCNLNCNTERDFKTHLSGKKHASKVRLVQKRVTF